MKTPAEFVLLLLLAQPVFAQDDPACLEVSGLAELLEPGRVFLLGELHGTEQSPSYAFSVACAAATRGFETVVGLELSSSAQPMVDRFLVSDGHPADREALLDHRMWQQVYQDGRNSRAMLALIENVRELRARPDTTVGTTSGR